MCESEHTRNHKNSHDCMSTLPVVLVEVACTQSCPLVIIIHHRPRPVSLACPPTRTCSTCHSPADGSEHAEVPGANDVVHGSGDAGLDQAVVDDLLHRLLCLSDPSAHRLWAAWVAKQIHGVREGGSEGREEGAGRKEGWTRGGWDGEGGGGSERKGEVRPSEEG